MRGTISVARMTMMTIAMKSSSTENAAGFDAIARSCRISLTAGY
jgi:hypothetical protein